MKTTRKPRRTPIAAWLSYDVTCIGKHRPFDNDGGLLFAAPNDRAAYRELARLGWRFVRGKGWYCPKHSRAALRAPAPRADA